MMVKAYSVTECVNYEVSKLVFANTANEAKTLAFADERFDYVEYTDLRAKRERFADGHENDSKRDLTILCIRNGWIFKTVDGQWITEENIDEAIEKEWL